MWNLDLHLKVGLRSGRETFIYNIYKLPVFGITSANSSRQHIQEWFPNTAHRFVCSTEFHAVKRYFPLNKHSWRSIPVESSRDMIIDPEILRCSWSQLRSIVSMQGTHVSTQVTKQLHQSCSNFIAIHSYNYRWNVDMDEPPKN